MTKATRERPPLPVVVKGPRGLAPRAPYDAEALDEFALGTEFELTPATKRSHRHLRTYWLMLKRVCEATDKWPTPRVLHHALKRACGYTFEFVDVETGEILEDVDSISFDAMKHDEFVVYMNRASAMLSEAVGFDVLQFVEDYRKKR